MEWNTWMSSGGRLQSCGVLEIKAASEFWGSNPWAVIPRSAQHLEPQSGEGEDEKNNTHDRDWFPTHWLVPAHMTRGFLQDVYIEVWCLKDKSESGWNRPWAVIPPNMGDFLEKLYIFFFL